MAVVHPFSERQLRMRLFSISLPLGRPHSVFEGWPGVLSRVQTKVWLPILGTLHVHGCTNTAKESALAGDLGRKIRCHAQELSPHQHHMWPDTQPTEPHPCPRQILSVHFNPHCDSDLQCGHPIFHKSLPFTKLHQYTKPGDNRIIYSVQEWTRQSGFFLRISAITVTMTLKIATKTFQVTLRIIGTPAHTSPPPKKKKIVLQFRRDNLNQSMVGIWT